ncbi:MAG: DNA polymerase III subunit [Bacillota bacterium]
MNFNRLKGQHELRHALGILLTENRLSHAILLTGPTGSGKSSWGMALAQAILCHQPRHDGACLECASCRRFHSGNHPEYFLIQPEGRNIKIEQIRTLKKYIHLVGDKKVCLIKQAESMTAEACSSLLKILEEPPEGLYFILLASHPRLLFDTILSRCQAYTLQPLNFKEVEKLLLEKEGLSGEKASFLARISGGLPGYAFELAEDEQFNDRFAEACSLASKINSGRQSAYQLLSWAENLAERSDLLSFLELLCLFYRDYLIYNLCEEENKLMHPVSAWQNYGKPVNPQAVEEVIVMINKAIHELSSTNVNRRLLFEKMLILMQRRLKQCPG